MITKIINSVCLRKDCKERCPVPIKENNNLKIQLAAKSLIMLFAGILIGGALSLRLHGQPSVESLLVPKMLSNTDPNILVVATRLGIVESNVNDNSRKIDHLSSELATVEGTGVGIGLAITGLQLLGFFVKSKGTLKE